MSGFEELDSVLLEYTQDKIALIDEEGVFKYVNDASREMLGYDPAELVGESSFEFIHPEDRQSVIDLFADVIENEEVTTETSRYRLRVADDSWVWMESRFSNLTDEELGGYVVSSRDITEQVDAERRQDVAEMRLQETTETVGDVVWMFSSDWEELLFVNPAYESVYGESVESLQQNPKGFINTIHPADRSCVREAMANLSDGESVDVKYRVDSQQNYDTYVWVQGEPIVDDGEVVRIVGFARDVTDRRRRERQLAVMDNLLRHNLRNDLTAIFQQTDFIIREGDEPSAQRAELIRKKGEELLASAEKQRKIITLLSDTPTPQPLAVTDLISTAVTLVREKYPAVSVTVDLSTTVSVCALHELQVALVELLENAVQHAEGSPEIRVTAEIQEDHVGIRVEDTCPPIPEEEFRVLTGDREMDSIYHSSGMGLWLAYWIVDLSDGWIEFEQGETGNTITVNLSRTNRS